VDQVIAEGSRGDEKAQSLAGFFWVTHPTTEGQKNELQQGQLLGSRPCIKNPGKFPSPSTWLLPPCWIWGHFVAGFMAFKPAGSCRLFCLSAEVTLRFMGVINSCPISALIEAICIVTKIIRDNFMGIF
jgi:hypothetical protein